MEEEYCWQGLGHPISWRGVDRGHAFDGVFNHQNHSLFLHQLATRNVARTVVVG
jgi:hypothetical protein